MYCADWKLGSSVHRKELDKAGIDALVPIKQQIATGTAFDDEIAEFVSQRRGRILSAFTLLKSDFFRYADVPEACTGALKLKRPSLQWAAKDEPA